jgi:hypothetical protein
MIYGDEYEESVQQSDKIVNLAAKIARKWHTSSSASFSLAIPKQF